MTPWEVNACLGLWSETEEGAATATLISVSENHTFRIDRSAGEPLILRVHRPGYQSDASIDSELEWLQALGTETVLSVARPLPGRDGRLLQVLRPPDGRPRRAVLFAFEAGIEPQPTDDLGALFATLGRLAAIAHDHAERFSPSATFSRQVWTAAAILDGSGPWGDWRAAPNAGGTAGHTLEALATRLRRDLAVYGTGRHRFGLIHADMRLANLLVDGERVTLIDFDDCGFCWFMYDFAAAISFFEDSPVVPELRRRWLEGYAAVRTLEAADIAILDTMVLLRRMALLAFIGSHGETELAKAHAADFARITAELAGTYLARPEGRLTPSP
ncbi:MAG: phosphotransferase [Devosia sp.]|nr:phosphotransferase [Devosia sp.]